MDQFFLELEKNICMTLLTYNSKQSSTRNIENCHVFKDISTVIFNQRQWLKLQIFC